MNLSLGESTTELVPFMLHEVAQKVIQVQKCCDSTQKELFNVLIIVLMIENGLLLVNNELEIKTDVRTITAEQLLQWKTPTGSTEVMFIMEGFQSVPLKLIISPLGATALVNVVIINLDSETYSVCLPIGRYVVSPTASTIPLIFRDLKHLSLTFKNKIVTPVKSRVLFHCGYPGASLIGLPEEVIYKISMYLPAASIVRAAQTCRRMKVLLDNERLWHDLYKRDFEDDQNECEDWKTLYRDKYVKQIEAATVQRGRAAGAMHDYMDYSDYVSYIDNPMWGSMII